ncbi:S8 family serine peptidase [Methylomonas sp. LL1]|uniref:S8 family peptidase n=1 Tax=Methylomonas sp. LL1 TaxID=2785785 RepID=UPI0018C37265|nr:S8 family serine peptidase [Methylomonas sp. LL1]QPK63371.1 S8 family serine peptidase [Methylomonas sp. LL1]
MKIAGLSLLTCLWLLLSACTSNPDLSRLGDSATGEDRRVVVTFADRTINRASPGNSLDGYRTRGQYNNSGWSERIARELADRHHLQMIAQWPVTALQISCVVYEVPKQFKLQQVMANLQSDRQVTLVQPMQTFQVRSNDQPPSADLHGDPYLPLQVGYKLLGVEDLHKMATGRGVRIALIDTGVDLEHPDLQGQIKYWENVAPEPPDHNLADIHGTAVAGVLSARPENDIGIAGIAPDAEVLAFRACWPEKPDALAAHCNSFTLAVALNLAIRMNSQIINLSLSGPEDPLLRQLIEKALSDGIIVIAAVPEKDQIGGFPANIPGVLAVGRGNEAQKPEIIAPGQDILTTVPHRAYDFMTGSSFATPHVAGLAALLLQLNPGWRTADIKQRLSGDSSSVSSSLLGVASAAK